MVEITFSQNGKNTEWWYTPSEDTLRKYPYLSYFAGALLNIQFLASRPSLILENSAVKGFKKVAFFDPTLRDSSCEYKDGPNIILENNGDKAKLPEVYPVLVGLNGIYRIVTIKDSSPV